MGSSGLIRWGAIGLMMAGLTWLVLGLAAVLGILQAIPGREDIALLAVALLLTAAGLAGLHTMQRGHYGLLGQAGFYLALVAIAGRILGIVVYAAGSPALEGISLPATAGMLVGFVLYGVATLRAGVLPRWYGVVLIVSMPVSLLVPTYYGTVLFGLFLMVLGFALWSRRGAATEQPSRVR